ncbi:MAG: Hsp20/alpha crystallin family protein [Gammaproteobacteria bacterium]|nr:Hsp20/alpha crystallin family protein [Gammaproteobacteria bacterium]
MAETATKLPVKTLEKKAEEASKAEARQPIDLLRREVDRLFDDFGSGFWRWPFRRSLLEFEPVWRTELSFGTVPAVDIVEKDKEYEISAELPGMEPGNIEINLVNGGLTIKGEKKEEKEEKKKDYYLSERRYGSFERSFCVPEGVDTDRIDASFKKGVLRVTLPKTPAAQKPEKKISVKGD